MMQMSASHKSKINLTDYPYRRDIENRLLMAHLSVLEVNILREVVHHSLKISIDHLAEVLEVDSQILIPILDKLSSTKIFKRNHLTLVVDKEMRKYYESQLEKFDEDFEPNMEFLQSLLNKIPIHVLPNWYAVPRSSDNIFASIVEKYFLTPKIYRQHLEELQFDNPIIHQIIQDLYKAPDYKLLASTLINKYRLTREQFEEYLLLLEYSFVCCLRYTQVNDEWQEVITPFYEWLNYLQFETRSKSKPIQDKENIQTQCAIDFGFIKDMQTILKTASRKNLEIKNLTDIFPKKQKSHLYLESVLSKLVQIKFINCDDSVIRVLDKGALWLSKSINDQVNLLANDPLNRLRSPHSASPLYNSRNIRQVEKGLKKLIEQEWIYVDDFLDNFITPIGIKEPVTLINKGKKWKYVFPVYNQEERQFIQAVITERLFELGIIAIGTYQEKSCFCLTPFGRLSIN